MVSVKLVVDRTGHAYDAIERGLSAKGVSYQLVFADEESGCLLRYGIGAAPCLIVDDRIVYHGGLSAPDLDAILADVRRLEGRGGRSATDAEPAQPH